jgi:glutathione synthase/RimK-type ligase-like ATP-grasp enzyme
MKVALIFEPGHRMGPILQQWLVDDGHDVSMISDEFTDKNRAAHYDLAIPYVMPNDFLVRPNPRFTAASYLEEHGCKMLNSIQSIAYASDKLATFERLAAHGIPTPTTQLFNDAFRWPESVESLIMKPRFGGRGENVELVSGGVEATKITATIRNAAVIQEFIPDASCYRIIASRNTIISQYEKYLPGAIVKNISTGATRRKANLPGYVLELVMKAVAALEGGLMGLDVLTHEGNTYILEANVPFGFDEHDKDIKAAWLRHVRSV